MSSPYRRHALAALAADDDVPPVVVRLYNRTGRRVGFLGSPRLVSGTLRDADPSTFRVEVDLDHHLQNDLQAGGARLEVDLEGAYLTGGWAVRCGLTGGPDSRLAADVLDYEAVLGDLLVWPVPTGALAGGQVREQYVARGPAETVAKDLVRANASRQGRRIPITVPPSQGRGGDVVVTARMGTAAEVLTSVLEASDLRVVVTPTGPTEHRTGLQVDVVPRTVYPHVLTEESGVVVDFATERPAPVVSRVVAGGGGEGVERDFRSMVDTAREDVWGREIEVFVDARDARSELDALTRDYEQAVEARTRARADRRDTELEHRQRVAEARLDLAEVRADSGDTTTARQRLADARAAQTTANVQAAQAVTAAEQAAVAAETARNAERPRYEADLQARMRQALDEGAGATSVSVKLSQTATFRYGHQGLVVGARVSLGLAAGAPPLVERLRSVEWSWAPAVGFDTTPQVGDRPPDLHDPLVTAMWRVARVLGQVTTAVKLQNTRR